MAAMGEAAGEKTPTDWEEPAETLDGYMPAEAEDSAESGEGEV